MTRPFRLVLAAAVLALPAALLAPASGLAARDVSARATDAPAGRVGTPIVLDQEGDAQFYGYDALATSDGRTYVAWIASHSSSSSREVLACVIPQGGTVCPTKLPVASLASTRAASGLRLVLVNGVVTIVWYRELVDGSGKLVTATLSPGGPGSPEDRADAPAFGGLYDATVAPDGKIWAVTWKNSGDEIQVHPGLGTAPTTINPTNLVGAARIAFDHDQGVIALSDGGSISNPVRVTSQLAGGGWRAVTAVPSTWSLGGNFDLVRGRGGVVRLVASVPNANYYPQIAAWKGTAFGGFTRTGYSGRCEWTTHDLYADASGRIADASFSCGSVRVFNEPTALRGAGASWSDSHTPIANNGYASNGPQIATSARGTGWIVYARENATAGGPDQLMATRIRLPAASRTSSATATGGRAVLTGPVSCLPAVDTTVGVVGRPASGWRVASKSLKRDGVTQAALLHGEKLAAGSSHTLVGRVVFAKSGKTSVATARLTFTACPNPKAF